MSSLNDELFDLLSRDPKAHLLSQDNISKAIQVMESKTVEAAERFRQGRKIIQVVQVKAGQTSTYKRKETESVYRTEDGKFERVKVGTMYVPLKPYVTRVAQRIPDEWIEDRIPVHDFFGTIGRALAAREDKDIVETVLQAADVTVKASTPGNLAVRDITNTMSKIQFSRQTALIADPMNIADLRKEIRGPRQDFLKALGVEIMRTTYLPEGTALVLDTDRLSVAVFERRPITVRLFDDPLNDCVSMTATQRYVPIVLDCSKVVKIINC